MVDFILNILAHILAYVFCAVLILGLLGMALILFKMIVSSFKDEPSEEKGNNHPMSWWVWWSATHND